MRKKLLTAASVLAATLIVLTSCLGDTESTRTLTNQRAYIDSDETGLFANLYYLGVRSNDLGANDLRKGDCVVLSFKYNQKNSYGDGTFKADYIAIKDNQIYKKEYHTYSQKGIVDTTAVQNDNKYYFESIENTSVFGYPTDHWGNKWFFQYSYTKGKGNLDPILKVYYDESKQGEGEAKKAGERCIDLQLVWDGDNTIIGDREDITKTVVLDLTAIRDILGSEENALKDKFVSLKIRYLSGHYNDNPLKLKTKTEVSTIKFDYRTEDDY